MYGSMEFCSSYDTAVGHRLPNVFPEPERDPTTRFMPSYASIATDAPTGRNGYIEKVNGVCRYLKVGGV